MCGQGEHSPKPGAPHKSAPRLTRRRGDWRQIDDKEHAKESSYYMSLQNRITSLNLIDDIKNEAWVKQINKAFDAGMPGLRGYLGEVYIKNVFQYMYGKIAYYFMRSIKGNISRHFRSFFYRRRVLCYTMSQQVLRQFSDQIYPDAQIYRQLARRNSLQRHFHQQQ